MDKENYEKIIKKVDIRVENELKDKIKKDMLGYRYYFDKRKKEILKNDYKIEWKTFQEKHNNCSID